MRRKGFKLGWLALLSVALAGCRSSSTVNYPKDPLFANKKPLENAPDSGPPVLYTARAPLPPALSPSYLVARNRPNSEPPKQVSAQTVVGRPGPVVVVPAVRPLPRT